MPPAEHVHWLFGGGFLLLGLCLVAETIVGREVWARRPWRTYLMPALMFALGLAMWPLSLLFTSSAVHMLAHWSWGQMATFAGAVELGRARGKLRARAWQLAVPATLAVGGFAFLAHEQRGLWFSRAAFLHIVIGWALLIGAGFVVLSILRPRSRLLHSSLALTVLVLAVLLFADRDVAAIFGHLSPLAGAARR